MKSGEDEVADWSDVFLVQAGGEDGAGISGSF